MPWETKKMLIWCQTYPALSTQYSELVCTGAIELGTSQLLRLYPLILRGLGDEGHHNMWSVIQARVQATSRDRRPESFRIDNSSIQFIERYEVNDDRRMTDLLSTHIYQGLEEIEEQQRADNTSMGLMKAELISAHVERRTQEQYDDWNERRTRLRQTQDLFFEYIEPVPFAWLVPKLTFKGETDQKPYTRTAMGWEIYALAHNVERGFHNRGIQNPTIEQISERFEHDLRRNCFRDDQDTYFAMGNQHRFPGQFSVISLLYPRRVRQRSLF